MAIDDRSLDHVPRKTRAIAWLIYTTIRLFALSYRARVSGERANLAGLPERGDSVILSCWHNRMFYFAAYIYRYLIHNGVRMTQLSSDSKDGEIGATIGKMGGMRVVRGSPTRRGASGLRGLYRVIVKEKLSIIILPDGSQGPVYQAKGGVVTLAKLTGKPIIPVSCWASAQWRIRSWDRMIFPKPFARVQVTVGEEIYVPREADEAEEEAIRERLQAEMDRLGFLAEAAFPRERAI